MVERILSEAGVVRWDGHSNYGRALRDFVTDSLDAIGPRTSVLILGDARSNHLPTREHALAAISRRAGRVIWLDPEPAGAWDTGDSVIGRYAPYCDLVAECRNLRQLRAFIEELDPPHR